MADQKVKSESLENKNGLKEEETEVSGRDTGISDAEKYNDAKEQLELATGEIQLLEVIRILEEIIDYKDSRKLLESCKNKLDSIRYESALSLMDSAANEQDYKKAASFFYNLHGYKDSAEREHTCNELAEESRKQCEYNKAIEKMNSTKITDLEDALYILDKIRGWKDVDLQVRECQRKIILNKRSHEKKIGKVIIVIIAASIVLPYIALVLYNLLH